MVALLLCAGFGTRLRPLIGGAPKALVDVDGRPILDYLMDQLLAWKALSGIHLVTNSRHAAAFARWRTHWQPTLAERDLTLRLYDDGVSIPEQRLGAVGDLRFLLDQLDATPDGALVAGGDSIYRFPLRPILNAFTGESARVLALHASSARAPRQQSALALDGDRVLGVSEAPATPPSPYFCPSWYLLPEPALAATRAYLDAHTVARAL